jgi:hypothetical protein
MSRRVDSTKFGDIIKNVLDGCQKVVVQSAGICCDPTQMHRIVGLCKLLQVRPDEPCSREKAHYWNILAAAQDSAIIDSQLSDTVQ